MLKIAVVLSLVVACAWGSPAPRVVGGANAVRGEFPFIVSLRRQLLFISSHFCGGSILSDQWVVTAAHCLGSNNINAVAGAYNLRVQQGSEQSIRVGRTIAHSQYVNNGRVGPHDIALLRLNSPYNFNQWVQPINLPPAGKIHTGETYLAGWGSISTTLQAVNPDILQTVKLPLLSYDVCHSAIDAIISGSGNPLDPTNICTGPLTGGQGACNGDSGGPLAYRNRENWELVGVVSWGLVPCGSVAAPSVFVRVSAYVDWINANTA